MPGQNLTHFKNCLFSQVPLSLHSVHQPVIRAAQHHELSLKSKTKTRRNKAWWGQWGGEQNRLTIPSKKVMFQHFNAREA